MTLDTMLAPFDDEFSSNFFRRRRIQFPSLTDSSTFFEDSKLDFEKQVAAIKREVEASRERFSAGFPALKSFNDDFAPSNRLKSLLGSDDVFNSSRAIESRLLNSTVANNNTNNSSTLCSRRNNNNNSSSSIDGSSIVDGKYTVNIPLGSRIQPEDLKISLKEENGLKVMSIEAKREEKSEDGTRKSFVSQQVARKFTLPPNVDIKTVQSVLTEGGNLKIEAPLQQAPPPPAVQHRPLNQVEVKRYGPTNIPITLER